MGKIDKNVLTQVKDYTMITVGLLCYCFGYSAFLLPEKIVTGGVTGLASLLYFGFGWNIAITYYVINAILLAIAFRTVGKQFVIRTVIGATIATLLLGIMVPLFKAPIVAQQPFMNVIIGAVLCGMGLGIVFTHNGSSAGTDIIAAMVTKHSNISSVHDLLQEVEGDSQCHHSRGPSRLHSSSRHWLVHPERCDNTAGDVPQL